VVSVPRFPHLSSPLYVPHATPISFFLDLITRKLSQCNITLSPYLHTGTKKKHGEGQSRQPVPGPRFKTGTSRIKSSNGQTANFCVPCWKPRLRSAVVKMAEDLNKKKQLPLQTASSRNRWQTLTYTVPMLVSATKLWPILCLCLSAPQNADLFIHE
jgi:hypothetical protein